LVYAFVEPNGTSNGSLGIQTVAGQPDVAASANEALFVWRTASDGNANANVAARRMLPDGSFPGPVIDLYTGPGMQTWPTVVFDGTNFVVAWDDQRNQSSFFDATTDVYGTRVSPSGSVLDGTGFSWASAAVASTRPSLATRAGGTLCAFSELRPESPLGGYRVATRGMIEVCAPPSSYCTSLPNSSGVIASIGWSGSPSFTTDDWSLTCSGLPPGVPGTFFMGPSALPSGAPFANGLRCVGLPFVRLGMIATNGGSGAQIQHLASSNFFGVSPGDTRYVQFWFRDGQAGGANANLSNALSVTFCP
jgi:hypothetical protein